jgi:flagellar protein FliS
MTYNKALNSYNQMNVNIDRPEKLILMLYEGALKFVNFAKKAIEEGNIEDKVKYIIKTSNIFIELINSLDFEKGGDIAYYLNGLYGYQLELLAKANLENKTEYLDGVIRVLRGLIEAWKEETGIN